MIKENCSCPLCGSVEVVIVEKVSSKELSSKYNAFTGVDFSYLINKDISFKKCSRCDLRYFDPQITGDQDFYQSLHKFDWYYVDNKEEYLVAKEYINEGDLVLDVGCGRGAFSSHVYSKNGRFIGLDFSENAKKIAEKEGVEIKNESIQDFADSNPESVDVVTSFQVCEHVADTKGFVEAKLRSLKSGGLMIIAVPSEDSFLSKVTNGILNMPPHHVTRWSVDVFEYIAKQYNLELENIHYEKLQDIHAHWYLSTLIQNSILKPRLLDSTIKRKVIAKISSLFAKLLHKGLAEPMKPNGHTVIAVFRKK